MAPRLDVTVLTATIPGREQLLAQCIASVYGQSRRPTAHLIMADPPDQGLPPTVHLVEMLRELMPSVSTEWVMRLDDDCAVQGDHLEMLWPYTEGADVVYSWEVDGTQPREDITYWRQGKQIEALRERNLICGACVLVRSSALQLAMDSMVWNARQSYWEDITRTYLGEYEDWAWWSVLARFGARFSCTYFPTWRYGKGDWLRMKS